MSKTIKRDLQQVTQLLHQGKLEEALTILEPLRAKHPDNFDVVYMLGVVIMIMDDHDRALDHLIHASALRPGHIQASNAVGLVLARKGEYEQALEHFDWSLGLDPNNLEAMRSRGGVLAELGRHDEAIAQWKGMGEKGKEAIEVQFGLGQIYEQRGEFSKAVRSFREVLCFRGETHLHEAARERLARIIPITTNLGHDLRMDVVMFCLSAIELLTGMDRKGLHMVLLELAIVGRDRLDINDIVTTYRVRSMTGNFIALQIICYIYTGFRIMGETMDVGLDVSREYEAAMSIWSNDPHE